MTMTLTAAKPGIHAPLAKAPSRIATDTCVADAPPRPEAVRLRAVMTAAVLACSFAGILGLAWDEQWHQSVGRDAFLTPPHALLYSATGVAGLLCLVVVLWQTWTYRRQGHLANGVTVFGVFHAPLGVVVAGFGALTTALAAPLDNYWHELYGVDVVLWAPFHMMGMLGGFIRISGALYLAASLLVARPNSRWAKAGVVLASTFLLWTFVNLAQPGEVLLPTFNFGPIQVMSYPLVLAALVPLPLLAVQRAMPGRWRATLVAASALGLGLGLAVYVPWAVQTGAALEGLSYRSASLAPQFNPTSLVPLLAIVAVAFMVDLRTTMHVSAALLGAALGFILWACGAALAHWLSTSLTAAIASGLTFPPGIQIPAPASSIAILLALPIAMLLSALSAALGAGWGELLRRNPR